MTRIYKIITSHKFRASETNSWHEYELQLCKVSDTIVIIVIIIIIIVVTIIIILNITIIIIIHLPGQNYPHHTMSISSSMDSESSTTNSPNPRSSQSKNKNKKGKKKKKWSNVDSRDNPPPVQYAAVDRLIFKATKQQKTNNSFCLVFIVNYDNYHKCWSASIWSLCMSFTKTKTQKNSFCTSGHYEKLVQCLYTIYVWWIYYIDAGD